MFVLAASLVCTPLPLDLPYKETGDYCVERVDAPKKVKSGQVKTVKQVDMPYGSCLAHVRLSFGIDVVHPSAHVAAEATKYRHSERAMPDLFVPVWFDHWGVYQGYWANWGHVVYWDPKEEYFVSTPVTSGFNNGVPGVEIFYSLEEIERAVGGSYRFWSEDLNGVRVVNL